MDRQSILGFVLIFIILVVWMLVNSPQQKQRQPDNVAKQEIVKDTIKTNQPNQPKQQEQIEPKQINPYGKFFSDKENGTEKIISIETENYLAEISSRGGVIRRWELKNYKTWDGKPVQLIDYAHKGDFTILLRTSDGRVINTKDLYFDVNVQNNQVLLENKDEFEVALTLTASNGGQLVKKLKFKNGNYGFDAEIELVNMNSVISNYQYEVVWENGIRYAEHNSVDESSFATAYAYSAKELTEIDQPDVDKKVQKEISGGVDWVAARNKYFTVAMIPSGITTDGAYLEATKSAMPDNGVMKSFVVSLKLPFKGEQVEKSNFKVYLGPLLHGELKSYGVDLEKIMSLGWAWLVRPISEYVMLPIFTAIHYLVPNWGLVIIIFSIIIKIALHPLSKSQMKSMKKMQKLQPLMDELREKYKDDPQKMNQSIMNLYKEYGVNPAGGCLPLLLQMPIMYALYSVFRGAIELRQASFIGWITDLSIPDVIYRLPSKLPIIGIQDISGIALIMGITMFFQTKMTTTNPQQKAMVWIMPIMMTLLFNGFPSGLNLYYAVFNILSIGQQLLINKQHDDEPLRKVEPKKKSHGGIFKFAKDMPRLKK